MFLKNFATRVLNYINLLPNEECTSTSALSYFESQLTIGRLKELLLNYVDSDAVISKGELELAPFKTFLSERCDQVQPDYSKKTNANLLCKYLARQIVIALNTAEYKSRENADEKLLMPFKHFDTKTDRENRLRCAVLGVENRNQFIKNLLYLNQRDWKTYSNLFSQEQLLKFVTNGNNNLDEFLEDQTLFTDNELYNKAILFCKFELHRQDLALPIKPSLTGTLYKAAGALYKSMGGTLYNENQKKQAIQAAQDFIQTEKSLADFASELNNPESILHSHKGALHDGKTKNIMNQITIATIIEPVVERRIVRGIH